MNQQILIACIHAAAITRAAIAVEHRAAFSVADMAFSMYDEIIPRIKSYENGTHKAKYK